MRQFGYVRTWRILRPHAAGHGATLLVCVVALTEWPLGFSVRMILSTIKLLRVDADEGRSAVCCYLVTTDCVSLLHCLFDTQRQRRRQRAASRLLGRDLGLVCLSRRLTGLEAGFVGPCSADRERPVWWGRCSELCAPRHLFHAVGSPCASSSSVCLLFFFFLFFFLLVLPFFSGNLLESLLC